MFYEVIIDSGEKANKCTIVPLSHRLDFRVMKVQGAQPLGPLRSSILLHHEGECLTTLRKSIHSAHGIAAIDCVWRRLDVLLSRVIDPSPIFARIPDGFVTAYPRRSAKDTDPSKGLATIEAIFIAAAMLNNVDTSLLSKYYFGDKFLELNRSRFQELGVEVKNLIECKQD